MNNHNIALQTLNTFAIACCAKQYVEVANENDLILLSKQFKNNLAQQNFYLLGEGSNTLFVDDKVNLIVKSSLKGISTWQSDDHHFVEVAAGENWHQLVLFCLEHQIYGLENLALIPGSVGAAPVQNIGAYGVEFADYCEQVSWFEFASADCKTLSNHQCQFAYRESIFKGELKNKGLITKVLLKFPKKWQPKLNYHGLSDLPKPYSAEQVMQQVIALRQAKLPDPSILPNAGSFFKNPVVTTKQFIELQTAYPSLPHYLQDNGHVKLAAAWLIEQAGLKGYKFGKVAVHANQALVLVNHQQGSGQEIVALAKLIQTTVYQKFAIMLIPEVRFVSIEGECDPVEVLANEQ